MDTCIICGNSCYGGHDSIKMPRRNREFSLIPPESEPTATVQHNVVIEYVHKGYCAAIYEANRMASGKT